MNPGLEATLDVHGCCRWIDPSGSQEQKRSKQPQGCDPEDKPPDDGPEHILLKQGSGVGLKSPHWSE